MSNDSPPKPNPDTRYDEDLLVELLISGRESQRTIARRVGISQGMVSRIANGQARPDIYARVREGKSQWRSDAKDLAQSYLRDLLVRQLHVAMQDKGETSRKCREYLLDNLLFGTKTGRGRKGQTEQDTRQVGLIMPKSQFDQFLHWQSTRGNGPISNEPGER
jgi:hypothetical protein